MKWINYDIKWVKKMSRLHNAQLIELLKSKPHTGFDNKKSSLVQTLRTELIIEQFNKTYEVGQIVNWRSHDYSPIVPLTIRTKAYSHHGIPVCFFSEKAGCCSIEPEFLITS
jgi:hypothetical protein